MQEEAPFFNAQIGVQKKPSNIIQQNSKSSNKIPNHPTKFQIIQHHPKTHPL